MTEPAAGSPGSGGGGGGRGTSGKVTILHVDDDPEIAQLVKDALEPRHTVVHVSTGAELKDTLQEGFEPDLILLDLMLPDADGLVLCADLNDRSDVPIIIVSGTARKRDTILGFKLGADDFLAKPFHVDELEARVDAVLRRSAQQHAAGQARTEGLGPTTASQGATEARQRPPTIHVASLTIDDARRQVSVEGRVVDLTPTEYRLLAILAAHPDEVLSRQDLSSMVWGYQDASIGRSIDVHVHRLRTKLAVPADQGPQIVSVRGFGYKLAAEPEPNS